MTFLDRLRLLFLRDLYARRGHAPALTFLISHPRRCKNETNRTFSLPFLTNDPRCSPFRRPGRTLRAGYFGDTVSHREIQSPCPSVTALPRSGFAQLGSFRAPDPVLPGILNTTFIRARTFFAGARKDP